MKNKVVKPSDHNSGREFGKLIHDTQVNQICHRFNIFFKIFHLKILLSQTIFLLVVQIVFGSTKLARSHGATLTWFNFKLGLGKKSSREVSRLTLRTMFNKNTKEFLVT